MSLIEVSVRVDGEAAEAVCELFNRLVPGGAVVEQHPPGDAPGENFALGSRQQVVIGRAHLTVKAYLPSDDRQVALRQAVEEGLWHLRVIYPFPEPELRELADADWAEAWKQHYTPQRVGRRLIVVPSWLDYAAEPGMLVIRLDPGMAFGTGLHPSTRLCCAALEDVVHPGDRVLDVGTGSGILAIAAIRLGASRVLGLDIDPVACRVAGENVTAEGLAEVIQIKHGTVRGPEFGERGKWDVVVANILAPVIIDLATDLAACLAPGGRIIVSGIIADQAETVALALAATGLSVSGSRREGDWIALTASLARR